MTFPKSAEKIAAARKQLQAIRAAMQDRSV